MRAIEKAMLDAINAKKNMQRDNTLVIYYPNTDTSGVFLYGHHIGTFIHISGTFRPDIETLKQWPTPTTKSRLRSLGINVYTKAGKTYLNEKEI